MNDTALGDRVASEKSVSQPTCPLTFYGIAHDGRCVMPSKPRKISWTEAENGCWNCTSHPKDRLGYCRIQIDGKKMLVHRFLYEQLFGELDPKIFVCHKCDNPSCLNPEHLFAGTDLDNIRDCFAKGRMPLGSKRAFAKLKEADIKIIHALCESGISQSRIAERFGVCQSLISMINRGKIWRHIV